MAIQQLTEAIDQNNKDKAITGGRLDSVFELVNQRVTELNSGIMHLDNRMDIVYKESTGKMEVITGLINGLTHDVKERILYIESEIQKVQREMPRNKPETYVPPTPTSWEHGAGTSASALPPGFDQRQSTNGIGACPNVASAPASTVFGIGANQSNGTSASSNPGNGPSFGAPNGSSRHMSGSNTAYFHVGSPGAPWSPLNPQNSNFGDWAPGAGTEKKPFDTKDWSVEGKKVTKELKTFDGDMGLTTTGGGAFEIILYL